MKYLVTRFVFALSLSVAGCGSSSSSGMFSCDVPQYPIVPPEHVCIDYNFPSGYTSATMQNCTGLKGTINSTPCSHVGAVFGCQFSIFDSRDGSGTSVIWYYTGTSATSTKDCPAGQGTLVKP